MSLPQHKPTRAEIAAAGGVVPSAASSLLPGAHPTLACGGDTHPMLFFNKSTAIAAGAALVVGSLGAGGAGAGVSDASDSLVRDGNALAGSSVLATPASPCGRAVAGWVGRARLNRGVARAHPVLRSRLEASASSRVSRKADRCSRTVDAGCPRKRNHGFGACF